MRRSTLNREDKHEFIFTTLLFISIVMGAIFIFLVLSSTQFGKIPITDVTNDSTVVAIVDDIYQSEYHKYQISASGLDGNNYKVNINLSQFLKYKIGDTITVRIRNSSLVE